MKHDEEDVMAAATSEKGHYVATEDGERCGQFVGFLAYYRREAA